MLGHLCGPLPARTARISISVSVFDQAFHCGPISFVNLHTFLELIYRSLQGMRVGQCQGWELSLAYSPDTQTTTGFFRGTPKSLLKESIKHLRRSNDGFMYPLLLPLIILTHEMSAISNTGMQCSRGWLQEIEDKLGRLPSESSIRLQHLTDLEDQLLKIHKKIVAKNPQTQIEVLKVLRRTVKESAALEITKSPDLVKKRDQLYGFLTLNNTKLRGLQADVDVTLSRIEILRSAVQNRLAVALADEQRISDRIKHEANMRYSKNQQTFSILGILFLPGTFFAVSSWTSAEHSLQGLSADLQDRLYSAQRSLTSTQLGMVWFPKTFGCSVSSLFLLW